MAVLSVYAQSTGSPSHQTGDSTAIREHGARDEVAERDAGSLHYLREEEELARDVGLGPVGTRVTIYRKGMTTLSRIDRMCEGDTVDPKDRKDEKHRKEDEVRKDEKDKRPDFDCEFDPDTGELDEPCVTEYLESNMPKSV